MTREELEMYLAPLDVPVGQWGTGVAKTIDHLVAELQKGECELVGVVRTTHTIVARIFYGDLELREAAQVFSDGRIRKRVHQWGSVGEKLKPHEKPLDGLTRALQEELGIVYNPKIIVKDGGGELLVKPSRSYPGLFTRNIQSRFLVTLADEYYHEDGYFERQPDKTTYFDWIPAPVE